jgi:hypothetical protein
MNTATSTAEPTSTVGDLSDREREMLAFERQWWKYAGAKEQAIKELFDMSATRYYQVLNALIDSPSALAADPMLIKRLRRLRASRQRSTLRTAAGDAGLSPAAYRHATPVREFSRTGVSLAVGRVAGSGADLGVGVGEVHRPALLGQLLARTRSQVVGRSPSVWV